MRRIPGQRNSRTRSRASCPTSRTSEHSSAGARGCDVRMFGCLRLDGPRREGDLLARLRTYLPLRRTTLTQQLFGPRPKFRRPYPSGIANSARHRRSPKGRADARAGRCGCWITRSWSITYLCGSSRDCLKTLRSSFNSARASRVYWPCFGGAQAARAPPCFNCRRCPRSCYRKNRSDT